MFQESRWFLETRTALELLYFVSGIVIAAAAVLALTQIRLTKKIAKVNARRESVRLAADQCKYFADAVVPAWADANREYVAGKFTFLAIGPPAGQLPFAVEKGEIVNHHFDLKALAEQFPNTRKFIRHLNVLESFAIPFAAGVADEDVGYRETARAFCQAAQSYMPVIFELRRRDSARYESTVRLYSMWTNRLAADRVEPIMKVIQQLKKSGEERIEQLGID